MTNLDWIEINLPWRTCGEFPELLDLSLKEKEIFGISWEEAFNQWHKSPMLKEYEKISDEITKKMEENSDLDRKTLWLSYKDHPAVIAHNKWLELSNKICDWGDAQPENVEYEKQCKEVELFEKESFCGKELNKPGTLIELENGKIELLGSVNCLRGVCDDCVGFDSGVIVKRYAVIFDFQNILSNNKDKQ